MNILLQCTLFLLNKLVKSSGFLFSIIHHSLHKKETLFCFVFKEETKKCLCCRVHKKRKVQSCIRLQFSPTQG